jgi:hydrogenase nickel incorporation protein HypB
VQKVKTIALKKQIIDDNGREADALRAELKSKGVFYFNLMSSPGGGKTTLIRETAKRLRSRYRVGVMEADIDSEVDAAALLASGIESVQLHTGGMCHLDAAMSRQGLSALGDAFDVVILENVGNLVCPAEFDTGASACAAILSVPEGDDKPLKYPLMFEQVDAVCVSKVDTAAYFDFDRSRFVENVHRVHSGAPVFFLSAKTGEGVEAWTAWLAEQIEGWKNADA